MLKNDGKRFFLIASGDEAKKNDLKEWLTMRYPDSVVYKSTDHMECLIKIKNAPPHLLIADYELSKGKPGHLIDSILADPGTKIGIIVMGAEPRSELHNDAMAIGRVQFINEPVTMENFFKALDQISNYAFESEPKQYLLKTLKAGEVLISEGDTTQTIYIVRKGLLRAYKKHPSGETYTLGEVKPGEFVGEMAYFNHEARMATVDAVVDSELIEIQPQAFEKVIYQKPSWTKTLLMTLAKRLKSK
jgi:CRP/FNR family cyclic AMP-dependent transcriptional regulator